MIKGLWIACILAYSIFAHAALSPASREILDLASQIDTERDSTLPKLQAKPRATVVKAVREGLATGAPFSLNAARAASALSLKEVVPELRAAFAKSQDYELALALGDLADEKQRAEIARTWQSKLESFESPTRVAIFQTLAHWQIPLTKSEFDKALIDRYPGVRIEAARSFFKTRTKIPVSEQTERYRRLFAMDPYQLRLDAMMDFRELPSADRKALASAIDGTFKASCAKEARAEVKFECEQLVKGSK